MQKAALALSVFCLTAIVAIAQNVAPVQSVMPKAAGKVADFTWKDGDKTVTLSEFAKNKVILLNFWGTWCPPCRKELPDIIALQKEFPETEFVIIGIAIERAQDPVTTVKNFMKKNNMDYQMIIGNQEIADAYGGITSVPTTFIIRKDFTLSEQLIGMRSKADFEAAVRKAMGK